MNLNYKKINISIGWLIFILASIVYLLTAEPTVSLWDCGEFITSIYKLEVGHPPGAPFFMLVGRIFTLLAGSTAEVAHWVNNMSALCSSLTIAFLFWSITLLGKKMAQKEGEKMTNAQKIIIFGSGIVGAAVYTFTETFWFSAVEGEVYAMSSLFTAIIFWAALKWDEEMILIKKGELSMQVKPLRWMVLIMFLFGLAIGVHLLGLLAVPAIAYIVAHQYKEKNSLKLFIITGVIGIAILAFIQNAVIPGTIALASNMEIFFVDTLGLPFNTGVILFFLLLVVFVVIGLIYTRRKGYVIANTAFLGLIVLLIGYGSFTTIVIRSNANPPLNENNPSNLVNLHSYLGRKQYGTWPILYGNYFNSKVAPRQEFKDRPPTYERRWVVSTQAGSAITSFKKKPAAEKYMKKRDKEYELKEEYFVTNQSVRENQIPVYLQNTIFPRMYARGDANEIKGYKSWSGYNSSRRVPASEIGSDGHPIPTFGENLSYFVNYQMGWMFWRYFMWNFAGRQNDIQGHGDVMRGNWISGYSIVDNPRLGAQGENAPYYTKYNPSHTSFYYIPIILALIGMFFHFLKSPKDAIVVGILFVMTGVAIIIYLNQKPYEPRERDYSYAAAYYAFSIWIGLGVYGLFEAFKSLKKVTWKKLGIAYGTLFLLCLIGDIGAERSMPATISILIIGAIGGGSILLMRLLQKVKAPRNGVAIFATLLGLVAPIIMGTQTWRGHDRSNRSPAHDLAYNYLIGCSPHSILYTNGDNDTFPLWYLQEVEGVRTDVRVANLSLMQTDWYTDQMKIKANKSAPLPIKFREDQILMGAGNTDYVLFLDYNVYKRALPLEKSKEILQKKIASNPNRFKQSLTRMRAALNGSIQSMTASNEKAQYILNNMSKELVEPLSQPGIDSYNRVNLFLQKIFSMANAKNINVNPNLLSQLKVAADSWTEPWDYLPIGYIMEFVRNDSNMLEQRGGRQLRFFPSSGFILPVNAKNAVKAGIIPEKYIDQTREELRFDFRKGGLFNADLGGLSREEVMMLDILANFDWNRGIFYSSPGGSNVAKAFYARGYLENNGQIYGLSPLKRTAKENSSQEKMYDDIMQKYKYGNLAAKGVLVDYYVRRHTEQYRNNFIQLASKYLEDYRAAQQKSMVDSLMGNNFKKEAQSYADTIEHIIRYSLEKLPLYKVFDFGTPRASSRELPNGDQVYTDGVMPEYIHILYAVNKKELADSIAVEYMHQLETMMNYFQHSAPMIAYNNQSDFISFSMNFLRTFAQVHVSSEGSGADQYGMELQEKLSHVVQGIAEGLSQRMVTEADRRGRTRERSMEKEAKEFRELYHAMLQQTGFQGQATEKPVTFDSADIEKIINKGDSTKR